MPTPLNELTSRRLLRLWPGVAAAAVQCIGAVVAIAVPGVFVFGMLAGILGGLAIIVWWLFFSRARWLERVSALAMMPVAAFAVSPLLHESIAGAAQRRLFAILSVPAMALGLVVWALASRGLAAAPRRLAMAAALLLACASWTLVRTDGVTGDGGFVFHWRWTKTAEERLLARAPAETPAPAPVSAVSVVAAPTVATKPATTTEPAIAPPGSGLPGSPERSRGVAWPGFRGPNRDGVVRGTRIETDWSKSPPVQLWRRPIGPGWSSFAVDGDLLYTQEQRGEEEMVACHRVSSGALVWTHRDPVRFYESNGGAGPRGTPTVSHGRVYSLGATGILNALDARTGAVIWSRNATSDTEAKLPMWGFTSSPLVTEDQVIVATAGTMAAYDLASGKPRWVGPHHSSSYSSPQLVTIDGVAQVVLLSAPGVVSLALADGALLWEHTWEGGAIVQPAITADGDILINAMSAMGGLGIRRLAVSRSPVGWTVKEVWTSTGLKPYFNDFVLHKGYAFGFDGTILSCIDLADGKRKWKGGRYGAGQLVLLAEQDLLLVLSEEGELALVNATTDKFVELARFPALNSKTWNHPVVVGDILLVRNGEEMAAFRLKLQGR